MAPELFRFDIYSLGMTLQLLASRASPMHADLQALFLHHRTAYRGHMATGPIPLVPPPACFGHCGVSLITDCCAEDARQRPSAAEVVAFCLDRLEEALYVMGVVLEDYLSLS